jgi:ketosteroid isomerase-like protein
MSLTASDQVLVGASSMRSGIAICWLLLLVAWPLTGQEAANSDSEKSKILALENAWNQAEKNKDAKALDGLLASNLVYIDYDGTFMDKAKFMASVKAPSLHPEQIVNESMTAYMYNDSAVVTGVYREKGVHSGKPYSRRGRFTDTWVKQGGTWVCAASQSTLISD